MNGFIAACNVRSVSSSASVGSPVVAMCSVNRTGQPVAASTCSRVTPGWSATTTSSQVSGSGSITARSVMTQLWPTAAQPESLAIALAVAEADGSTEVATLDESTCRLAHDHHHGAGGRSDFGRAACAWQTGLRRLVRADDGRVDVGVLVELGAAEEPDVDAPGLQPVGEDLRHADRPRRLVSASSPSPIDSGSRVGLLSMHPDS